MALTRKFLSAMGIDDDKAGEIINAHLETVNPLKQERDDLKEKAGKFDEIQKQLDAANSKLKEYENDNGENSWKVKYDNLAEDKKKLQKSFDDYKANISAKELLAKKSDAYKALLKEAGISEQRFKAILRVTDLNDLKITEEGKFENSDDVMKTIKSEWAGFIGTTQTQGAQTPTPPDGDNGGSTPNTRAAEIAKAHYARIYGKGDES